ncbi:MAG: CcmD family protein [Bacteroidetes bacterium MED-G17]|nr:MAG: hypothetical protein CBB99_06045 [Bacteroidetes bacterium TMED39]PDH53572.1 MAG: CcmD family protein [Bacteroidetes bacterium MED-G17]CAI8337377.1 MAG: Uncharacterised protein [Bacteroidetes bacterium MED-G17]|tara:strand:+ start:279 stop:482 length:204 start_codon:yes stop_codon:yes gene_type:complete
MNKIFSLVLLMACSLQIFADNGALEPMYKEGKIYVVVLVLGIIFLGLALFLFRLDRRISQLEKKENE